MRLRRVLKVITITVVSLLLIVVIAAVVLLRSDFAREKVRGILESSVAGIIDGEIHIGAARGGLLGDLTLIDVWIRDSRGQQFVAVDTVRAKYDIMQLLRRRFVLRDVVLSRPVVLLDQKTGEQWNYARIFRLQADTTQADTTSNNMIVRLDRVRLINGDIALRSSWQPDSTLTALQRASAISSALSDSSLLRVERVGDSYQLVQEYSGIHAALPTVRISDPGQTTMLVLIDSLSGDARAFKGDAITIRHAAGEVEIAQDSLFFRHMHLQLPGSLLRADGTYGLARRSIVAHVFVDSVSGTDARHFYRRIPGRLKGSLILDVDVTEKEGNYRLSDMTILVDKMTARGNLDLTLKGVSLEQSMLDADLRVTGLDAALIRELAPGVSLKPDGTFNGTVSVSGALGNSSVNADLTFDDKLSGRSHALVSGGLGISQKTSLRNLTVQFSPLQFAFARNYVSDFPLDGMVTGSAILNGVVGDSIRSQLDLQLTANGRSSRIAGNAAMLGMERPVFRADLRADPIDLAIINEFAPNAKFVGAGEGSITLNGPLSELLVGADFAIRNGGGTVAIEGTIGQQSDMLRYNLTMNTERLNLAAVIANMETTAITSVAHVQGRGVEPGTLVASLDVQLRESLFRDAELDSARIVGALNGGVLRVDSLSASASGIIARANGSLGITDSTTGVLQLVVSIDSLSKLERWIPRDTGKILPRPGRVADAYRIAREDSARIARATEIQRLISGGPPPSLNVKSPPTIPADSLAGSASFKGEVVGNITRLEARGELAGRGLVAMGSTVDTIDATAAGVIFPGDSVSINAKLRAAEVTAAGFAIDTISGSVAWARGTANVDLVAQQGAGQRYEAKFDFSRVGESTTINLAQARLRFDSLTTWETRRPSRFVISNEAITVDSLDVRAGAGGVIQASGRLARSGAGNIGVAAYGLEVSHLFGLMQSDIRMSGVFSGALTFSGSLDDPAFKGAAGFVDGAMSGRPIPEMHATFDFAGGELKTEVSASRKLGATFATGTAILPLDLHWGSLRAPAIPAADRPLRADFVLDSVPLELVPNVVSQVSRMSGALRGEVHVVGTTNKPDIKGEFSIVNGSAHINSLGVQLQQIAANLSMEGDTVIIRSFTARSGGEVKLQGGLGLTQLNEPSFDLRLTAREAYVLNNDKGRLRADVDVSMAGPFLGAAIEGTVDIINGVVYIPNYSTKTVLSPGDSLFLVVLDTNDLRAREIYQEPNPFMENLVVNVDLTVARDTWARSVDANIELFSDDVLKIGLKRANRSLSLDGSLSADKGQYTYFGKRFEIKRGSATFVGTENETNPILQITGDHEVQLPGSGAVNISVMISGTLQRPKITLQSDAQPPLSQTDMFAYLAFGHSSGSLLQIGASTLAPGGGIQGVGRVAGQQLPGIALGVLMDEIERAAEGSGMRRLGLDFLNIVPADTYAEIAKGDIISFLRQTGVEAGRYVNTRTYVAGNVRLSATPGIRAVHRASNGYRLEMSWEPRLLLREPTLSEQRSIVTTAFGFFLFREWRF